MILKLELLRLACRLRALLKLGFGLRRSEVIWRAKDYPLVYEKNRFVHLLGEAWTVTVYGCPSLYGAGPSPEAALADLNDIIFGSQMANEFVPRPGEKEAKEPRDSPYLPGNNVGDYLYSCLSAVLRVPEDALREGDVDIAPLATKRGITTKDIFAYLGEVFNVDMQALDSTQIDDIQRFIEQRLPSSGGYNNP